MDSEKSLVKITTKYHCMVSGKNQMEPCEGCSNTKGCLSKAMQYKENEEMDELNEKAIVKIGPDGAVTKCAKGLGADECGYKAGAKVCGACGAMASFTKGDMPMEDDEEEMMPMKKGKGGMSYGDDAMDSEDEEDMVPMKKRSMSMGMDAEDEEGDMEMEMPKPKKKKPMASDMESEDDMSMDEEDEDGMGKTWMMKPSKRSRMMAMKSLEVKSADIDDSFLCQLERKVYSCSTEICENCPGGCQSESGMPGVLDVEGMGLSIIGGKVLDSGYSFDNDLFVVQIEAKDGRTYEMIADGQSGEMLQLQRIRSAEAAEAGIEEKSAYGDEDGQQFSIIDSDEAMEIALKSLESEFNVTGDVVAADSDVFMGHDVYAVEIDGTDGKSYDVYVTLDGQFVGLDEWTADEAAEIEAEAAEIALKRAYSEDSRMEMAKRGFALPDGSYPIKDVSDLRNAIQAYGRAKDKEKAKAHIIKRAMALGAEDMIPMNWVPKDVQDKFSSEKSADDGFLASLMEFTLLEQEQELKDYL